MDRLTPHAAIEGIATKKLLVHPEQRGRLFETLRSDDPVLRRLGPAHVTSSFFVLDEKAL